MEQSIPRRWTTEVDGIRWIPRMIDKARMKKNGTLGAYLMGHSPVDRALLKRLNLTTDQWVEIATSHDSDLDVLNALRARGFDETAVRAWSAGFEKRYATLIGMWDLDEGYRKANPIEKFAAAAFKTIEGPVMAAYRRTKAAP
jgi:hypothetical protein